MSVAAGVAVKSRTLITGRIPQLMSQNTVYLFIFYANKERHSTCTQSKRRSNVVFPYTNTTNRGSRSLLLFLLYKRQCKLV